MNSVGLPELFILITMGIFWLIPLVAAIWALITLHRMRTGIDTMVARLESIERALRADKPPSPPPL
jgi:hypothetical protein